MESSIQPIKNYIIDRKIKLLLLDRSSEEKSSDQIYTQYPQLFGTAFNNIEEQKIETLNTAGYLYYKSVLLLDELIDNEATSSKIEQLFLSNKLQEESIKLLTSVFGLDNTFWDLWSKRQQEYFRAIQLEKQLNSKSNFKKYQQVADLKAAFGKVAIDCLYVLSKEEDVEKYNNLLQSHFHFSVALQLIDDLQDLEEDINNKQFNWAYHQATTVLSKEGYDTSSLTLSELKKLMYIKTIATDIREEALIQLNKSKTFSVKYNPIQWLEIIENQEKEIMQAIDKINAYKCELISKTQLSTNFINNQIDIKTQFNLAKEFLVNYQNEDGSWFDYNTNAGMSNVWSTAFILNNILDIKIDKKVISKAISFFKNNKQQSLWGYNTSMLPDNDSSSFVLMVLYHQNVDISKELEIYLSQQSNKGGFSTYIDRKKLSNYLQTPQKKLDGWLQEHICVSAVSYYLMERLNLEGNPSKDKLHDFLFKNQRKDGLWISYWWTSPIYATSFIIQAYFINNTEINESISRAISGLLSLQQSDGSFIDNHNTKSSFYTALVIIALCSNKTVSNEYQTKIKLAIDWLLSQQTKDGSFISTYSLQLPNTSVLNPKNIKKWTKGNSQATNIITNDFMRLFTTSTCAKALDLYRKNGSK